MTHITIAEGENAFTAKVVTEQSIPDSAHGELLWLLYGIMKRVIDVAGALCALALFSPIMIVVAILIKLDSPGPIFLLLRV